jgi:hypothetical protein
MVGDELQAPDVDGLALGEFKIGQVDADGDNGMF